jgi:hypothetical protein
MSGTLAVLKLRGIARRRTPGAVCLYRASKKIPVVDYQVPVQREYSNGGREVISDRLNLRRFSASNERDYRPLLQRW